MITKRGKHMYTGYLGGATSPDLQSLTLEQRVARLERVLDERERKTAERRMWLWYYAHSALLAIGIAVIVYLAGSLD
jgi:hypothetical protein